MSDPATAREAITLATDGDFAELSLSEGPLKNDGPIGWPGYSDTHARASARTGETESVVCGTGRIGGVEAVVISFEFRFLGGSLGERTGARAAAAHALARERRLPVVVLPATGGSRMHEGMRALLQLQFLARESSLTRAAGLPQIAVLRDPTTGGGWATLGAGSDVVLALPGAQVGFAGSRVRPPDADPAAYTAEAQLAHGHIDAIVPPKPSATPSGTGSRCSPAPPRARWPRRGPSAPRAHHPPRAAGRPWRAPGAPNDPGRPRTSTRTSPTARRSPATAPEASTPACGAASAVSPTAVPSPTRRSAGPRPAQ